VAGRKKHWVEGPFSTAEIAAAEKYIRKVSHAKQADFVFDPARFISLLCGRGTGKTFAELCRILLVMLRGDTVTGRGAQCLYMTDTRDHARGIAWQEFKALVAELDLGERIRDNETRLDFTFANGSILKLHGFGERDEIEKLRGITWHEVALDESGLARTDLLTRLVNEIIGPRLVGSLVLLGTPGYRLDGLFYDATRPASGTEDPLHRAYDRRDEYPADWDKWSSHSWSSKEGAEAGIAPLKRLWQEKLRLKASNSWSDTNPKWLREGLGQWAQDDTTHVYAYRAYDDDGHEFNQWSPEVPLGSTRWSRLPPGYDPKTWGYGIAMDVGYKDAFALCAFAFGYAGDRVVWQIGEFYKTKQSARAIATLLIGPDLRVDKPGGIIGELGWPDFMVADLAGAGEWFERTMREEFGIASIQAADKHAKYKDPAIESVNAEMFEGRIRILKGSALATELSALQWIIDANGRRLEDPKQANHACFVAGTLVRTDRGELPIETIRVGDLVWTRSALRPVLAAASTGVRQTVVLTTDRGELRGTHDHPVWTDRGLIPLGNLTPYCMLVAWESTESPRSSYFEEKNIDATQTAAMPTCVAITRPPTAPNCTARNGWRFVDQFRRAITFITQMVIRPTTGLITWLLSEARNTCASICSIRFGARSHARASSLRNLPLRLGIDPMKVASGIGDMPSRSPRTQSSTASSASSVTLDFNRSAAMLASAAQSVSRNGAGTADSMTSNACALNAELLSCAINTTRARVAPCRVESVTASESAKVYNLTVDVEHEYFANGILVGNCDSLLYGRMALGALLPGFDQKIAPQGTPSSPTASAPRPRPSDPDDEWSSGDASDGWSDGGDGWSGAA
jgi:hypothetical protein